MSNLLHRTFNSGKHDTANVPLTLHKGLMSMAKWFRKVNPDMTVAVFDRPNSWRKQYTASGGAHTPLLYKGHRRQNMSPTEEQAYHMFLQSIEELEALLHDQTRVVTLAADGLEADDLIAGLCQMFPDNDITVVSGDTDFVQLLSNPRVTLIDPSTESTRTLDEYGGDAGYFLFHKCCKGDAGDNVMRIFPRVYSTRVKEYYTDELKRVNAFNESWEFKGTDITPGVLFEENKLLMDLSAQPQHIRTLIDSTIVDELSRNRTYNMMKFLRFCGQHSLLKVAEDSDSFTRLFSTYPA